jgi:hypothetical protein
MSYFEDGVFDFEYGVFDFENGVVDFGHAVLDFEDAVKFRGYGPFGQPYPALFPTGTWLDNFVHLDQIGSVCFPNTTLYMDQQIYLWTY